MKIAQEVRAGNVIMIGKDPMVVQKAEFNEVRPQRVGRQDEAEEPAVRQRARRRSIAPTRSSTSSSSRRKEVTYSYFADPMYVFMDNEFNQYDVEKDNLGDALPLPRRRPARASSRSTTARRSRSSCPTSVVREVTYTEPAVKGDTSGKVMKPAKLANGFEVQVPLFVTTGDRIEIDTRTGEYRRRV